MVFRQKRYFCPICASDLGVHDVRTVFLIICPGESCGVKWCFKANPDKPIPIDWPGMTKPKICNCESCKTRDSR